MSASRRLNRRKLVRAAAGIALGAHAPAAAGPAVPDRLVVLTFDDAVKSHRTFVAPMLKELGFGASFFITHNWMADAENFLTWKEAAEIHEMGFEIGNHSWTHPNFAIPKTAARMAGELALVENELRKVGVPKPVSFAYSGNGFGPEAVRKLSELGYRFARRGMQPEKPYGQIQVGPGFEPRKHHPLLIPTTGDAYPQWTLEHFRKVVAEAKDGRIVVLQFHGVPDPVHPWVHTPPERFREYMGYLKENGFRCIALRDVEKYLASPPPEDPMLQARHPMLRRLDLPPEAAATQADLRYWLANMLVDHGYSFAEMAAVAGLGEKQLQARVEEFGIAAPRAPRRGVRVLPYPGGRHPRIGFLDGAIDPMRGTKASVFLPWSGAGYLVIDLPEAVFSNLGLIFLAHTHVPTVWDQQNVVLDNIDWTRAADGSLSFTRTLPNKIALTASIAREENGAAMSLSLHNGTDKPLTGLRVQMCAMLKGARGFNSQTNDNKQFRAPVAAVRSDSGDRWILMAWERCGRAWGNPPCPCLHSDPVMPDCPPGETVRVRGRLRFYEGRAVDDEIGRLAEDVGG